MSSLEIVVAQATNVPNAETFGKSDPYVGITLQGITKKTEVKKGDLNPTWNETLGFDLVGQPLAASDELQITIKDWEMVGRNRLLCQTKLGLKSFISGSKTQKLNLSLTDHKQRPTKCKLALTVTYKPPAAKPSKSQEIKATVDEPLGCAPDENVDDLDGDEDFGVGEEEYDTTPGPDGVPKMKKKRRSAGKRKLRGFASNKPQDFQIRIKVVEGRQLPGANICPVSRVTCYNQTKQTRVQKSTNSPFWNEVFYFNFFCSPSELFDELVTFGVYNSRKLRSDALIGSFKCDIGMIYDEDQHSLIHKWLLLSDPEDNMAGAKGYLKICASVLGPGDEAPSFKSQSQDDDEDIESNLLRPAGVQLRPATFALKLYRAEDIPRMDSAFFEGVKKIFGSNDKKELVDPYFVFTFAGQEVRSKILYNNENPEFNQELRLGLKFPSMCERIKFQMFDWDRITEDDCISSAWLQTTAISRSGEDDKGEDELNIDPIEEENEENLQVCVSSSKEMYGGKPPPSKVHSFGKGFLPTFGPCYVNFYGSPREYTDLPDEYDDLNMGKGEGVAFRGRALVELTTALGDTPELAVDDIHNDDILRVQKFQRRRKYKLHAAFLNACMISSIEAPVEFEVSIGNYGNKLDESVPPCSSTTQPTNAVFDGSYYYFLPWGDTKPCVVVDSHWEDISWRLETLNFLNRVVEKLEVNVEKVRVGLKANLPTPELAQLLISLLDQLMFDCKKPLPQAEDGRHQANELDKQLYYYRETELKHIYVEAKKLRESATDVSEALNEVETYLAQLKNLAIEPQNSMPDVVIWMISGDKRIAYFRCPAYLILWSPNPDYCGKFCGKLESIMLKYPGNQAEKDNKWEIPALLRLKVWLGLEKHEAEWHKMQTEGDLAVFAETYENQVSILGNWIQKGPTMSRPKWSDATGKVKLPKEEFNPPPGWRWENDWYISPELSMLYDKDAGHTQFLEDLYECQSRMPAGTWDEASVPWTDVKGDACIAKGEIELPDGWDWDDEWNVDLNRAVDEDGFEYCVEATIGGYGPVEKNYHMCRRRRWVRSRQLVKTVKHHAQEDQLMLEAAEGWEYAPLFNMKFHHKERKMDLVRRRRWHRKMVAEAPNAPCFFQIASSKRRDSDSSDEDSEDEKYKASLTAPRMFLTCKKAHKYQLRAYIYQARELLAGDSNGLSDPFARVAFLNQSEVTEKLEKTLCPTWDQTLIYEQIEIHGDPESIVSKPPEIIIEIFDHDTFGSAEFLGRTCAYPMVKLDPSDGRTSVLQWYTIQKGDQYGGELLAAFELYLMDGKDLPFLPPKRGKIYTVPNGIRPVLQRTAIEVMCWGVRNMKKFQLSSVSSPSIEFEVGGHLVQSKVIRSTKKNPNFDDPLLFFDIMLPREELYTPPLNIRVRDNRQFGRKPMVGVHVLKSLEEFRCDPTSQDAASASGGAGPDNGVALVAIEGPPSGDHVIDMPLDTDEKSPIESDDVSVDLRMAEDSPQPLIRSSQTKALAKPKTEGKSLMGDWMKSKIENQIHGDLFSEDIDWWSKYYASVGELEKCKQYLELGYDKIQVFSSELEKVGDYGNFSDFCNTFELSRGKNIDEEESSVVGEFKGTFRIYPLPADPNEALPKKALCNLPPSTPEECVIRVYIVKAVDLQPNDPTGLADPYISIKLGKQKVNNRDNYKANTLDPEFGRMFELKAVLPMEKDLYIRIKDYDLLSTDDVIGETVIDLENRYLSKYRALVGLPRSYCVSGPCEWRDSLKPKELLVEFCKKHTIAAPVYSGNTVVHVGGKSYNLADFEHVKPTHSHLGESGERLALHVLNTLPASMRVPLVPEHVEKRPLYNPLQPGIEQGKVHMWVDIFPLSLGPPGVPVDIMTRKPKEYELRIVVWNTVDVILEEESITGEKMSDIYVKGWLSGIDDKQETDVHYRSLDGEGNFNWRFIFPFEYLPAEESLVVRRKEHFWSLDETELKLPLQLMMQIWDNDKFSADDFLGTLELNLSNMPAPAKKASQATLKKLPDISKSGGSSDIKMVSLFEQKRIKGFWPCYSDESGERVLTGKVEMELELMTKEESELKPCGKARDDPNEFPHLDPPNRPETSFLWFTSPWKTLKFIIWKNYKWYFITGLVLLIIILFVVLFVYSMPGQTVKKLFGT